MLCEHYCNISPAFEVQRSRDFASVNVHDALNSRERATATLSTPPIPASSPLAFGPNTLKLTSGTESWAPCSVEHKPWRGNLCHERWAGLSRMPTSLQPAVSSLNEEIEDIFGTNVVEKQGVFVGSSEPFLTSQRCSEHFEERDVLSLLCGDSQQPSFNRTLFSKSLDWYYWLPLGAILSLVQSMNMVTK